MSHSACRYLVDGMDPSTYALPSAARMVLVTSPDRNIYWVSSHHPLKGLFSAVDMLVPNALCDSSGG